MGLRAVMVSLGERLRSSFAIGPVETLLCLVAWLTYVVGVQADTPETWRWVSRITMGIGVALPLLYATSFSLFRGHLTPAKRWGFSAGAVVLGVFVATLVEWGSPETAMQVSSAVATSIVGLMVLPRIWGLRYPQHHQYLVVFWERFATSLLACVILWGGTALALAALEAIFALNLSHRIYLHTVGLVFIVMFPALIVGDIPVLSKQVDHPATEPSPMLLRATKFVFVPLLITYLVLAFLYIVTRLLGRHLETEIFSSLVLGASALVVFGHETYARFVGRSDDGVARLFRILPYFVIPPLLVSAAFNIYDLSATGYDEASHVQLAASLGFVVALSVSLWRIRNNGGPSLVAPRVVFAVVALGLTWGPWSVVRMARAEYAAQVRTHALESGVVRADQTCMDAQEIAGYSERLQAENALQAASAYEALGMLMWRFEGPSGAKDLAAALGCDVKVAEELRRAFDYRAHPVGTEWRWYRAEQGENAYRGIPAGDAMVVEVYGSGRPAQILRLDGNALSGQLRDTDRVLAFGREGETLVEFPYDAFVDALPSAPTPTDGDSVAQELLIPAAAGRFEAPGLVFIVNTASVVWDNDGDEPRGTIERIQGLLVFTPSLDAYLAQERGSEPAEGSSDDAQAPDAGVEVDVAPSEDVAP